MRGTLAPFFPVAILDRVRSAEVDVIPNPPFREEAIDRGIPPNAIDFTQADGPTLQDLVLVSMRCDHTRAIGGPLFEACATSPGRRRRQCAREGFDGTVAGAMGAATRS